MEQIPDEDFKRLRHNNQVERMMLVAEINRRLPDIEKALDKSQRENLMVPGMWVEGAFTAKNWKTRKMEKVKIWHCVKDAKLQELLDMFDKTADRRQWNPKKYRDEFVIYVNKSMPFKAAFSTGLDHSLYLKKLEKELFI